MKALLLLAFAALLVAQTGPFSVRVSGPLPVCPASLETTGLCLPFVTQQLLWVTVNSTDPSAMTARITVEYSSDGQQAAQQITWPLQPVPLSMQSLLGGAVGTASVAFLVPPGLKQGDFDVTVDAIQVAQKIRRPPHA